MRTTQPSRPSAVLNAAGVRACAPVGRETLTALPKSIFKSLTASAAVCACFGDAAAARLCARPPAARGPSAAAEAHATANTAAAASLQPLVKFFRVFIAHTSALDCRRVKSLRGETLELYP